MKRSLLIAMAGIFSIFCINRVQAQDSNPDRQAIAMLREFYTAYITAIDHSKSESLDSIQKRFCTPHLLRRLPELGEKEDQDPFLKAQDSNIEFLKSLTVVKDEKRKGHYIVSYGSKEKISINVMVVRQNGLYKMDNLW